MFPLETVRPFPRDLPLGSISPIGGLLSACDPSGFVSRYRRSPPGRIAPKRSNARVDPCCCRIPALDAVGATEPAICLAGDLSSGGHHPEWPLSSVVGGI